MGKLKVLLVLLVLNTNLFAQQFPFYEDIRQFMELDKVQPPPKHAILFVGSSSFKKPFNPT